MLTFAASPAQPYDARELRALIASPLQIAAELRARGMAGLGTAQQVAQGSVAAGGSIAAAIAPASAIPIIGAAVAGVTLALALIFSRKGPKQKIASTSIVNDLEPALKQNLQAYMEGPRTAASQAQALKNFDDTWTYLTSSQACGSSELGNPGKACIADRSRGGKWDWAAAYRDPIANDAPIQNSSLASGGNTAWIIGGLVIVVALVIGGKE